MSEVSKAKIKSLSAHHLVWLWIAAHGDPHGRVEPVFLYAREERRMKGRRDVGEEHRTNGCGCVEGVRRMKNCRGEGCDGYCDEWNGRFDRQNFFPFGRP